MKRILIGMLMLFVGFNVWAADRRAANRGLVSAAPRVVSSTPGKAVTTIIPTSSTAPLTNEPIDNAKQAGVEPEIDEEYINEIKLRYAVSYGNAQTYCTGISDRLDKIKLMAGITTGTSIAGTLGGGTAAVTGFMRGKEPEEPQYPSYNKQDLNLQDTGKIQGIVDSVIKALAGLLDYKKKYDSYMALGTVRTVGSFTAGGANVAGAATSFIGLNEFDGLISDMDLCNVAIGEIEKEKTELAVATSEADEIDPLLATMEEVITNCEGLDSKNISDIKGKTIATGAIVSVSAATGIAGGVTSIMADNQRADQQSTIPDIENKKSDETTAKSQKASSGSNVMNTVSNILAVTTTAGSLAGAITSGMTLVNLEKNSKIAKDCMEILQ